MRDIFIFGDHRFSTKSVVPKKFIKCMLDNQDATYGISTAPLRAVPRGEHIINGWFDGHMKHTYLTH